MSSMVRYSQDSIGIVSCEDCGVVVTDEHVHTRLHSIMAAQSWALAVLQTGHIAAHVHNKYEMVDRINSKRFDSRSSDATLAEVASTLADTHKVDSGEEDSGEPFVRDSVEGVATIDEIVAAVWKVANNDECDGVALYADSDQWWSVTISCAHAGFQGESNGPIDVSSAFERAAERFMRYHMFIFRRV